MTKILKVISVVLFLLGISVAQYAPIPNAAPQFSDSNGAPLSGGKLFTYACGTVTPLASYTDATGGTTNANPIILNSAGFPANASGTLVGVFLGPSCYKLQMQNSSSVIQWTVDNVYGGFLFNGYLTFIERADPTCIAGDSLIWAGTSHRFRGCDNNGTAGNFVRDNSTDTFTNKTYDTAGTGNSFSINGLAATANTGTGSVVRATSPTVSSPTITTGITSGSGFKHQRFGASCTTAAAVGAVCDSAYTWSVAWADTNYTAVCTASVSSANVPVVSKVYSKSTTQITVTISALTAAAASAGGVDCVAVHD